ncbi:MAG: hypothetical protein Q7J17_06995, partial [Candidatus Deferrimicrobium sp.]
MGIIEQQVGGIPARCRDSSITPAEISTGIRLDIRYDYIHTFGMKTAVSIPDKIFRSADSLAKRLGVSRSRLYADALADFLSRRQNL